MSRDNDIRNVGNIGGEYDCMNDLKNQESTCTKQLLQHQLKWKTEMDKVNGTWSYNDVHIQSSYVRGEYYKK